MHSKVSLFVILTHPAGRLLLGEHILYIAVLLFVCFLVRFCLSKSSGLHSGIIAFFITCAFAAPVDEEKGTLNQYINRLPTFSCCTAVTLLVPPQNLDARHKDCDGGRRWLRYLLHRCHRQKRGEPEWTELVRMKLDRFQNWRKQLLCMMIK